MNDIKIEIPKELAQDIQDYGNEIAKQIAITAREKLTKEYQYAVDYLFYDAYEPMSYKRTWQLRKSYLKYYTNAHKVICYGGIEISTDRMQDTHQDSNEEVLGFALEGWHGNPSSGIFTAPGIYDHMMDYREQLWAYSDLWTGGCIKTAQKSRNYNMLF